MNKEQMQKFRAKLGNSQCPICAWKILQCYSIINGDTITKQEELFYNEIDISKDCIDMECKRCGYVMTFNKETLFR